MAMKKPTVGKSPMGKTAVRQRRTTMTVPQADGGKRGAPATSRRGYSTKIAPRPGR